LLSLANIVAIGLSTIVDLGGADSIASGSCAAVSTGADMEIAIFDA
jgi:hypothetical protein